MDFAHRPIGVFDSGIGGLTVFHAMKRRLPHESMVYFGDRARCPYGDRDPDEVERFALEIGRYLERLGIKLLVVACNTATAVALPRLKQELGIDVVGVIEPGASQAIEASETGRIGVIGTSVTVSSHAYAEALRVLRPDVSVVEVACPLFVPLVEQGHVEGDAVEAVVRESLQPLLEARIDTLVLGCTHYPLLMPVIRRVLGPSIRVISSADATAERVARVLAERGLEAPDHREPDACFLTTGDTASLRMALATWFGEVPGDRAVRHVSLPIPVEPLQQIAP
ncbi:glutamate racemase [Alicyclobacillus acidocaldarius]|uniref:Glutamate racemase n=1 Tax=Alicyclobacillus acidocaldarius subsp. acidocaldarius (strain ATCC 27009 / DSM 446 / BCRC 14685 / JCM 5260 / KCTC 1825 / NBRC 15652 / NCIMB 11725 / NRRL B-14509 / 104-IA) TaxID=521098 RepID=C8WXN9_ALIAD|nr:glutamate racemase [Alicyclobacillus acidocaldarius]ACV58860.1 glutamate racemase [Alicyclobacillus acidocaldarius subsp. acidocaldarius DSM 446]